MLNPYEGNMTCLIPNNESVTRPDRSNEIAAINAALYSYGLAVDKVTEGISIVSFSVILNADTPIAKVKKLNYSVMLNDSRVTVEQDGARLIIRKPQDKRPLVRLDDLYCKRFVENGKNRPLMMIGKDQDGTNVYKNLTACPHMLVSGTTGSGKSMFLHQVICSLLLNHNDDIEFIGIDMKRTEFKPYAILQNFTYISDVVSAISTLKELCNEMDRRYRELDRAGVRDIDSYKGMRRLVVIIDEFTDLIKSNKQIEGYVVRLAQKARACGIHLIIATQYPKADVVTGLIKANIPCRVAMHLHDGYQSRVAIDRKGAESLLGKGDMLFDPNNPDVGIMRVQAAYVDRREIENIVSLALDKEEKHAINRQGVFSGLRRKLNGFFSRSEAFC